MKSIRFLIPLLVSISLSSCVIIPEEEQQVLDYENILIYSDLSSRMDKNPNDSMVLDQLLNFFVYDCVKPGIKVNDRSSISFSRINYLKSNCPQAKIDIYDCKNLEEKQLYVNNKSKTKNLNSDVSKFKQLVSCIYNENDKGGLDILSLLYNEINNGSHIKKPTFINGESDTTFINYYNQLFIFTDGYLEYSTTEGNPAFYFGEHQIKKIRQICELYKISPEEAFKRDTTMKIQPLKCDNNKFVNLYVLETYDRGLNIQTGTLKHTGKLSDNYILKTAWTIWATESGFRHFDWKPITSPSTLPKDYIKSMIVH